MLEHNLYWSCSYCSKEYSFFNRNLLLQLDSFPPQTTQIHCISHTYLLSKLFTISFFKHRIINRLSTDTATIVSPVGGDHFQSLFGLLVTMIKSCNYVVIYFRFAYFILSIVFLNKISIGLVSITSNKAYIFFVFVQNLFIRLDRFYFFEKHEVIVWVLLTIYIHYLSFPFSKIWLETDSPLPLQLLFL